MYPQVPMQLSINNWETRMAQLLAEIQSWLETPSGKFEVFYAGRQNQSSLEERDTNTFPTAPNDRLGRFEGKGNSKAVKDTQSGASDDEQTAKQQGAAEADKYDAPDKGS